MAHRLPSSSVSLPHEYRSNGWAAIYPFQSMLRLSVVCSIDKYLTFPILLLNFSGEYTISTDIDNLTFHVADSRPSLNIRAPTLGYTLGVHVGLHDPSVFCFTTICSQGSSHVYPVSFYTPCFSGITHDTTLPITVSWFSPLKTPLNRVIPRSLPT